MSWMEIYCIPTISNGMDIQYPQAQQMRTASTCSDESNKRDIHTLNKHGLCHGLRTPNEGINQINLKIWANVADKICFSRTIKFGSGSWFLTVQWRQFSHRVSIVYGRWSNFYLRVGIPDQKIKFWTYFERCAWGVSATTSWIISIFLLSLCQDSFFSHLLTVCDHWPHHSSSSHLKGIFVPIIISN